MAIRNFIINLYLQNPTVYLSATDCRKKVAGDVCAVLRVHEFLDVYDVINCSDQLVNNRIMKCSGVSDLNAYHNDISMSLRLVNSDVVAATDAVVGRSTGVAKVKVGGGHCVIISVCLF